MRSKLFSLLIRSCIKLCAGFRRLALCSRYTLSVCIIRLPCRRHFNYSTASWCDILGTQSTAFFCLSFGHRNIERIIFRQAMFDRTAEIY